MDFPQPAISHSGLQERERTPSTTPAPFPLPRCIYYDYDDELRASVFREYGPATLSPYAANASHSSQPSCQCDYVQTRAHFRVDTDGGGDGNIFVWPRNVVRDNGASEISLILTPPSTTTTNNDDHRHCPPQTVASPRLVSFVNVSGKVFTPNTVTDPCAWKVGGSLATANESNFHNTRAPLKLPHETPE